MADKSTEKVVRAFDYAKFDNIDISDDEATFHPNIESNFNIKINREVRTRKEYQMEEEKKQLQGKKDAKSKAKLQELEKNKIWHAGNMCDITAQKTIINQYDKDAPKLQVADTDNMREYLSWRSEKIALLKEFVDAAGDMEASRKILVDHGAVLLPGIHNHLSTYLMLTCLEEEMEGNSKRMVQCATQNQMVAHIQDLATSFKRQPRDLVVRWFEKIEEKDAARNVWETDVKNFVEKVKLRAIDKKKEQEIEEKERKAKEEAYIRRTYKVKKPGDKENKESSDEEEYESCEAVPLVKAMRDMTKTERLKISPKGLDPLEIFDGLPKELKACFESQSVDALLEAQKAMEPGVFSYHLERCIDCGLWSTGAESDDEDDGPTVMAEVAEIVVKKGSGGVENDKENDKENEENKENTDTAEKVSPKIEDVTEQEAAKTATA